ncbi:MAG: UvrD-helicase domain-containing protein [Chromatiales bacterium]|nr:UvrD-helicase domain-containing protein [Chromatiales bacterium]
MHKALSPSSPELNATVMASAGTGKTFLLVSRLLRLLLAGARPDAILAITFTRKAAAEMQSRLAERLRQLAAADADELAERLHELDMQADASMQNRARRLYEILLQQRQSVRTTTFHAFCQEILLRFPLEADVPPGFGLLESTGELRDAAWQAMLAQASQRPDGELALALQQLLDYCGGLHNLGQALNSFLDHRGDWWAYTEQQAQPEAHASAQLAAQLAIESDHDPLYDFFHSTHLAMLGEFAELLRAHPTKTHLEALEQLALARSEALPLAQRFAACQQAFLTQKGEPRARNPSKVLKEKMGEAGEARFLAIHQQVCAALLAAQEQRNAAQCWRANQAWYLAGTQLLAHYQRLKREQRLLDFTDLEWQAYQLLNRAEQAHWVQYKLDQHIDHLLVDEFQDTNPTQWRLLLPILQEMAAGAGEHARSVFLVGDAKQSIYRFRRAEPRLFQAAHQWLENQLQAQTFPLHTSWRSAPAIMQCVNQLFGPDGPMGGLLRDFSPHRTHHQDLPGQVTVLPLIRASEAQDAPPDSGLRDPLQSPRRLASDTRFLEEGRQIAANIQQLIQQSYRVGQGEDAHPIGYGDIMILVRKRSHVGDYEQALREQQIPYLGAERGTLLDSIEVRDMLALLECLLTPLNNLALATVLRSPLFACSDDDLIQLASVGKGNWYPRLQAIPPSQSGPLHRAAQSLQRWRALTGSLPIHDLLDHIYAEANVLQCYQAAVPAHLRGRVVANLTRFIELALDIDSGRYPSLGHFLARLEALRNRHNEAPDEAPADSDQARVRIMTIHASKGLEAPVVFLADSSNSDSGEKPWRALLDWPPQAERPASFLLAGKKAQQPELVREQLAREQLELQRELGNLCYVALTRARQWLYISAAESKRGMEQSWYMLLRQALDPLGNVALEEALRLHSGAPQLATATLPEQTAALASIDPALTRPIPIQDLPREIAPSLLHSDETHWSGLGGSGEDEDGRLRGTLIHRLLQRLSDTTPEQQPTRQHAVATEFGMHIDDPLFKDCYREVQTVLNAAALQAVFAPQTGVEFLNEVPIIYTQDGQTVHGIIDRLRISEDAVWIIDYKSHRLQDRNALDTLAKHYQAQLDYYARGVQALWPTRQLRRMLLFTHSAQLYEFS